MSNFAQDYKDVAERIADFKAKHPEGCLRPANLERPYTVETIGADTYIVYVAAAYRSPDDPCPGIGAAWEPYPGKTNFTKLSELQNAETSAWGRAIVAVLASESKHVASADDVRNRQADHDAPSGDPPKLPEGWLPDEERWALRESMKQLEPDLREAVRVWAEENAMPPLRERGITVDQANELEAFLDQWEAEHQPEPSSNGVSA